MMLVLGLASSAPASASPVSPKAPIASAAAGHCSLLADHGSVAIADSWTWDGFVKFWKQQLARTAGVVGVVMLVAAAAVAIIISRARR
jgi:hypothetical protein